MNLEKLSLEKFKQVEMNNNSIHSICGGAYWTTAVVTAPRDTGSPGRDFDSEDDWVEDYDPFE